MKFQELAEKRQSCRAYKDIPVEREKLQTCIEAARLSPSACNSQPWSFVVVDEPERAKQIFRLCWTGCCRSTASHGTATPLLSWWKNRQAFHPSWVDVSRIRTSPSSTSGSPFRPYAWLQQNRESGPASWGGSMRKTERADRDSKVEADPACHRSRISGDG